MIVRHDPPREYTCARKVAYRRLGSAVHFGRKSMAHEGTQLYVYQCNICRLWHLTSHPKADAQRIEAKQ